MIDSAPPGPPASALGRRARALLGPLALAAAGLASLATSTARVVRQYPDWHPEDSPRVEAGCASAFLWVAKSGKQGLGVAVRLEAREPGCTAALLQARLRVGGHDVAPLDPPAPLELAPGTPAYAWLAFPFDGDEVWNSGDRHAALSLTLAAGGAQARLDLPFHQVLEARASAVGGKP